MRLDIAAVRSHSPREIDATNLRAAAVLVPVQATPQGDKIVFVQRLPTLRAFPGEIAFPGGNAEPGEQALACALREAGEEILLDPDHVHIAGALDQVSVSERYRVAPFVGLVQPGTTLGPGEAEVQRLIEIPVRELLAEGAFGTRRYRAGGKTRSAYQFKLGDEIVWGATARILKQLLEVGYGAHLIESPAETHAERTDS